jgi:DNA-binding NarL/FixJ family response regulator
MLNPATEIAGNGTQRRRRVLILDDHPIFRVGLADLTRGSSHLEVCGSADCAPAALDAMRHLKPDLVLLDLSLPGTNGIELIKSMKAERPDLAILVISMHDEPIFGVRTLKAGALGYVTKAEAANQVEEAISKVLQGKIYVSPEFGVQLIFKAVQSGKARTSSLKMPIERISERCRTLA